MRKFVVHVLLVMWMIANDANGSRPSETPWNYGKFSMLLKNMTLLASEIKFTDTAVLAKNVNLKAEEFAVGNFYKGEHIQLMPGFTLVCFVLSSIINVTERK